MTHERQLADLEKRISELESLVEARGHWEAIIELDGFDDLVIYGTGVPPVGSRFSAHKHTTDGGTYASFEVISHEWELTDTCYTPDSPGTRTGFAVRVKTRRCD